jgi:hypothetical protein
MKPEILVQAVDGTRFEVTVREGRSETRHIVNVEPGYARDLVHGKKSAEELVRLSFEFLLENEPKESILRTFDLRDISRYFPAYEREVRGHIHD